MDILGTIVQFLTPVVIVAGIVLAGVFLVKLMYKVAEPNEALIISGFGVGTKGSDLGFKSVAGGGTFVIPSLQIVRAH